MGLDPRNGSSKHSSESEPEAVAGEASGTNPLETYPKLRVRTGSSNHFEMSPEMIDGSPGSTSSEPHPAVVGDQSRTSDNDFTLQPDAANEGSPSSSASSEDLFLVEIKPGSSPLMPSIPANEPLQEDALPVLKPQENAASSSNTTKLEEKEDGFPGSTLLSPVSNVTPEPNTPIMSPKSSPPLQVMERTEGYDPYRIPPSVFNRNGSTTPLEWSVASNESLFSIHVGNNSFSRDHSFVSGEMYKSGELYTTGELTKSGELFLFSPKPPLRVAAGGDQSSVPIIEKNKPTFQTDESLGVAPGFTDDKPKEATKAAANYQEQNEQKKPVAMASRKSSRLSIHSGGSGDSVKSFAFPVLTDRARSSEKISIDQEERNDANVEEEKLQPSPAAPASPKSGLCSWFNCFPSCCPWSCPNGCGQRQR